MCDSDKRRKTAMPIGNHVEREQEHGDMEQALLEEVEFWKSYINYCLEKKGADVPVAAHDALEMAKHKLRCYLQNKKASEGDQADSIH